MSKTALYQRAKGFGIASYKLDGMNLSTSNFEVKKILTFHRRYKSPAFIEFHTYRFHRHFANEVKRKVDYIDESFEKK